MVNMVDFTRAFGLLPIKRAGDQGVQGAKNSYCISSDSTSYATKTYKGDPVIKMGTSNTSRIGHSGHVMGYGGRPAGELSAVTLATVGDGNRITGPVVGIAPDPSNPDIRHRAASVFSVVEVADDPSLEFEIMANGALTAAQVGLNAVLVAGTGDDVTGQSGYMLETTATDVPAADSSNQLLILRVSNDMRRGLSATYPVAIVKITAECHTEVATLGIV